MFYLLTYLLTYLHSVRILVYIQCIQTAHDREATMRLMKKKHYALTAGCSNNYVVGPIYCDE